MIKTFDISPYTEITSQVVQEVFETMLCSDVREVAPESCERLPIDVTAAIFFNGDWKGATYVECTGKQATLFTQQLMNIPRPTEVDSDTRDAMGELVNMIGGNLKSALPKKVSLSLPCVMEGQKHSFHVCKVNKSFQIAFAGECGTFWVTMCTYMK